MARNDWTLNPVKSAQKSVEKAEEKGPRQVLSTDVTKKENVTKDEKVINQLRMKYSQCALSSMLGTEEFSDLLANPRTAGGVNRYRQFLTLDPNIDVADMVSVINRVPEANEFFNLDSRIASSLFPYIRIFFVDRSNESHEYVFNLEDTIAKNPSVLKGSLLGNKDARGGDAGLLELTVEDKTSQPAEEGNTLVVNLKLFFRTLRDFLARGTVSGKYTYSDLVRRRNPGDIDFDPLDHRLRIIYGYQIPSKKVISSWGVTKARADRIVKSITHSRRVMNLTLRDHTFDIAQDGTVRLDITYNAALDGILRDPRTNILVNRERNEDAKAKSQQVLNKIKKLKDLKDSDEKEQLREEIENDKKAVRGYRQFGRQEGFDRIVQELVDGDFLKRIFVPEEILGAVSEKANLTQEVMRSEDRCPQIEKLLTIGKYFTSSVGKAGKNMKRREKQLAPKVKSGASTLRASTISKNRIKETQKYAESQGVKISGIMREIIFFHYGDLLEVVLKILKTEGTEFHDAYIRDGDVTDSFPTPLLGPVYVRRSACGDLEDQKRIKREFSIADIPITLDTFSNWFVNSIVKTDRDALLFRDFVDSINKDLLPTALGEGCRNTTTGPMVSYASISQLTITKRNSRDRALGVPGEAFVSIDKVRDRVGKMPKVSSTSKNMTKDYTLIYVPGFQPQDLDGSRFADGGRGIYHLYLGRDAGVILNTSLERNNQPFFPEAKVEGSMLGNDITGGNRYDMTLELVGNTFFRIGHYFFVNAVSLGLGRSTKKGSLASQLGIGGYYQCNKINYILTPSTYKTEIQGIFMYPGGKANVIATRKSIQQANIEKESDPTKNPDQKRVDAVDTFAQVSKKVEEKTLDIVKGVFD